MLFIENSQTLSELILSPAFGGVEGLVRSIGCGYVCRSGILPDIMVPPEAGEARPTINLRYIFKEEKH